MYNFENVDLNKISISISKDAYNISAIKKCCSNYMHLAFIKIEEIDNNYIVFLKFSNEYSDAEKQDIVDGFYNELLSESIRYDVSKETKDIRELIIGRALYATCIRNNTDEVVEDNEFQVKVSTEDNSYSIDDIAVNWFEKEKK